MINEISDLSNKKFMEDNGDEDMTFMFEALVCENDCLKQELERMKNQRWNQMSHSTLMSKRNLVRLIQSMHSDMNHIARTMANIAGMEYKEICAFKRKGILRFKPRPDQKKDDEPDEFMSFIEVYSMMYNMLSMADRRFALERRHIQGTKLDYICNNPETLHKFSLIVNMAHQILNTMRYSVINVMNQTVMSYQRRLASQQNKY